MNANRISWTIGASCLAILLLLLFQVSWLNDSRRLIEEQFDQKVTMALGSAIDQANRTHIEDNSLYFDLSCEPENCLPGCIDFTLQEEKLELALQDALIRYQIDLDFTYKIVEEQPFLPPTNSYCSPLGSANTTNQALRIDFTGKEEYVIKKMGFMVGASIFILLFICTIFALNFIKLYRMKEVHKASVSFFNNMAHEFRTPLTNISLALTMFNKKEEQYASNRFIQIIAKESQRLQNQVEYILHAARQEKEQYACTNQPINLLQLTREVIADMELQIQQIEGEIQLDFDPEESYFIKGDAFHLSNAIRNIVDNALKYCHRKPCITLSLRSEEGKVYLGFQDNGIGISKQHQEAIFEGFYRASNSDSRGSNGYGLGLAYVKKIIQLHDGKVELKSQIGSGTQVQFILPTI